MSFGAERVFISYRRSDAEAIARSLYEALKARFGARRVFFDTSSIPFGEDFRRVVQERIRRSAVVIVVIGPGWVDAADERGQRLRHPDDPVRFELVTALGQGRRIVPLRVGGAPAPRAEELPPELAALAFLNMPQLHAESFDSDVNALCRQLTGETDDLTLAVRPRALAAGAPLAAALVAVALLAATWTGAFGLLGLDDHAPRALRRATLGVLSLACVGVAVWLARGAFLLDLVNALLSLWLAAVAVRAIQVLAERLPRFRRLAT